MYLVLGVEEATKKEGREKWRRRADEKRNYMKMKKLLLSVRGFTRL